jgi:hypothetical protein
MSPCIYFSAKLRALETTRIFHKLQFYLFSEGTRMTISIELAEQPESGIGRVVIEAKNVQEQARAHRYLAEAASALQELDRSLKAISQAIR